MCRKSVFAAVITLISGVIAFCIPPLPATLAQTPTPIVAPVAGRQGKIAFVAQSGSTQKIFVTNADGSNPHAIVGANADWISWSPDGKYLVFTKIESGERRIYSVSEDSSGARRLIDIDARLPTWSPDGKHIAFVAKYNNYFYIHIMDADGSNQRRLSDVNLQPGPPAWSPDGKKIMIVTALQQIYLIDVADSKTEQLTDFAMAPAWSPNGTEIIFSAFREGGAWYLYIMNADGSNPHNITPKSRGDVGRFAWSPDGKSIAFVDSGVYLLDLGTSTVNTRLSIDSPISELVWSPDSTQIAFVSSCKSRLGIRIINIDRSNENCLVWDGISETTPTWTR